MSSKKEKLDDHAFFLFGKWPDFEGANTLRKKAWKGGNNLIFISDAILTGQAANASLTSCQKIFFSKKTASNTGYADCGNGFGK